MAVLLCYFYLLQGVASGMIHKIDPRQKRLFDPCQGLITLAGHKIITGGVAGPVPAYPPQKNARHGTGHKF